MVEKDPDDNDEAIADLILNLTDELTEEDLENILRGLETSTEEDEEDKD